MADVTISYKNNEIATMNATGVKTLLTGDTFCEDDIVVAYTKPAAPSPTLQSKTVYPSASDQTTTPDQGYDGLSSVISKGVLLTNLTAGVIKKDVVVKVGDSSDDDRIISITGTYDGGGGSGTTAVTFSMLGSGSDYSITYVDADGNTVNTAYWNLDSETVNATLGTPIATCCVSPFGVETVPTPTNTSTFSSYTGSAGSRPTQYYAFQVFIVG